MTSPTQTAQKKQKEDRIKKAVTNLFITKEALASCELDRDCTHTFEEMNTQTQTAQFNLSEKINKSLSSKVPDGFLFESDVKEFIRLLKERIEFFENNSDWSCPIQLKKDIDALAGEKLC